MTFFEAPCPAHRGGHRLVDAGRTPNGLYRMVICMRYGGKILARSWNRFSATSCTNDDEAFRSLPCQDLLRPAAS